MPLTIHERLQIISIDPEAENRVFFPDEAASLADEVRREFIWGMP